MEEAVEYETGLNIFCKWRENKHALINSVLDKPIVNIEEENKTVTAGDQVTLVCQIDANPMNLSLVEWYSVI